MTTPTELFIVGPWDQYRDLFRRAKQQSPTLASVLLVPTPAFPGCGRALAFGDHPQFACYYILIRREPEKLLQKDAEAILGWYLGLRQEPRAVTTAQWLSKIFDREVREVPDEYAEHGYEGERVFHAVH